MWSKSKQGQSPLHNMVTPLILHNTCMLESSLLLILAEWIKVNEKTHNHNEVIDNCIWYESKFSMPGLVQKLMINVIDISVSFICLMTSLLAYEWNHIYFDSVSNLYLGLLNDNRLSQKHMNYSYLSMMV